jgi:hypothetical protein
MKKQFWRKSGKEQAAKCPVCGKYMDIQIVYDLTRGTTRSTREIYHFVPYSGWICRDCNESLKR